MREVALCFFDITDNALSLGDAFCFGCVKVIADGIFTFVDFTNFIFPDFEEGDSPYLGVEI